MVETGAAVAAIGVTYDVAVAPVTVVGVAAAADDGVLIRMLAMSRKYDERNLRFRPLPPFGANE